MLVRTTEQIEKNYHIPFGITTKEYMAIRAKQSWISHHDFLFTIFKRMEHCDERIAFWKDKPEIQQVWIGIKQELTMLKSELHEETNDADLSNNPKP
jgi:hypothetical protein